ncbi:MAG: hypothetical protein JXC31_01740 [Acholeplasmataceae bacterium]|nr:hypothetical protein [Acholeplasmataceae bacterium]
MIIIYYGVLIIMGVLLMRIIDSIKQFNLLFLILFFVFFILFAGEIFSSWSDFFRIFEYYFWPLIVSFLTGYVTFAIRNKYFF